MFCKECGAELNPLYDYCQKCGANDRTAPKNVEAGISEKCKTEKPPLDEIKQYAKIWWVWAIIIGMSFLCILIPVVSNANNMTDKFQKYLNENAFQLPSGSSFVISDISRDHEKYYTVLAVSIFKDGSNGKWVSLSLDNQKKDMEALTDAYMDFTKKSGMNAYYYLYATQMIGDLNYVYNAEKNVLYYPDTFAAYADMYSRFNTVTASDLTATPVGERFLIQSGLATYQNKQVIPKLKIYYNVFISGGDFDSYGENMLEY